MKKLVFILLVAVAYTCVDPIEFEAAEEVGVLVVDGFIGTGIASSQVKLQRTDILGKRVFPPVTGARILIFDDQGKSEQYEEIEPGNYQLPGSSVWGQVGQTYFIEIELSNGTKYQSKTEKILPAPAIDNLTFDVSTEFISTNEIREFEQLVFNLYVNGTLSGDPEQTFLQWQIEHVYAISEIVCSPLSAPKTCYIRPPINPNDLFLLDGSQLAPGARFSDQLARVVINEAFGQSASFYVTQRAITERAFQYWSDVDQVVNNVGSIFDAPPASIPGNIVCLDDPTEPVLGYFSAYDQTKKLALIRSPDLGQYAQQPLCGLPGLAPTPLPQACCSCTLLDFSSLERPDYWP